MTVLGDGAPSPARRWSVRTQLAARAGARHGIVCGPSVRRAPPPYSTNARLEPISTQQNPRASRAVLVVDGTLCALSDSACARSLHSPVCFGTPHARCLLYAFIYKKKVSKELREASTSQSYTSTTFKYYTAKTFLTPRKSSKTAKTPSFAVKVPFYIRKL